MPEERALIGAKEICRYLRWSMPKFKSKVKEMKEHGVLIRQYFGKPPNRSVKLYTFPSLLQRYLIEKYS